MKQHTLTKVNPVFAYIMTLAQWSEAMDYSAFTPNDGDGHFAKKIGEELYEDRKTNVWDGPPEKTRGFTHVTWYNK